MIRQTLLSLALLAATTETALIAQQPNPTAPITASQILGEVEDLYRASSRKGLTVEADVKIEKSSQFLAETEESKLTTSFLAPSKIRVEKIRPGGKWEIDLNNGAEEAMLRDDAPVYRRPAPRIWREHLIPDEFPGSHFLIYDSLAKPDDRAEFKGEETITMGVGAVGIPCYVIEVNRVLHYRGGTVSGISTLWIGKARRWVYKEISSRPERTNERRTVELPSASRRTVIMTRIQEDPAPQSSAFDVDAAVLAHPYIAAPRSPSIQERASAPDGSPAIQSEALKVLTETSLQYKAMKSYRGEHTAVYQAEGAGATRRIRMPVNVSYRRPGLWRMSWPHEDSIWFQNTVQPDGFFEYRPVRNTFWRIEFTQFMRPPEMLYEDIATAILEARLLPNETITAAGESIECAVVEASYGREISVLQPWIQYASPNRVTFWIDPVRKLVLRWRSENYTETVERFEIDPILPDSEFEFTPPPGAKKKDPDRY